MGHSGIGQQQASSSFQSAIVSIVPSDMAGNQVMANDPGHPLTVESPHAPAGRNSVSVQRPISMNTTPVGEETLNVCAVGRVLVSVAELSKTPGCTIPLATVAVTLADR